MFSHHSSIPLLYTHIYLVKRKIPWIEIQTLHQQIENYNFEYAFGIDTTPHQYTNIESTQATQGSFMNLLQSG